MAIYEEYLGRHRDSFESYEDCCKNYKLTWKADFNFAYDVIDKLGTEKPDKLALLYVADDGSEKRFTFRDMMLWSNKAANCLKKLGIKKGDRVLLVLRRSYLFWIILLGMHKIGAVVVQANDMLKTGEYIYRCNVGGISAVILTGHGKCTEIYDEGEGEYEYVRLKMVTGHKDAGEHWIDFEEELEKASDKWTRPTGKANTKASDPMMMCFSSGTTGYPKMIVHDFSYPLGHIATGVFWHRVVDGGLHFTVSDTGWMKSVWGKLYGQWFGESAILVYDFERFVPKDILNVLEKYKVTTFCVPPTMYRFILQEDVEKYDLSSITHCCTAGEALPSDVFLKWKEITGLEIYEGFGQSETPICVGTFYPWNKPVPGSMGLPAPGFDITVRDLDGDECKQGITGEVCIKAPTLATRPRGLLCNYNWSKEDTKEKWYAGYYHTGDTAYRDEQGYFHYVGRNDDVIKSSGYRIGPFEVESVLLEHPAVLEAAVTAYPHETRGQVVKANLVLREGYTPSDELTEELQQHVKQNTAPYKYPRIIEYFEALPKTFSGKIRRVEIRDKDLEKYKAEKRALEKFTSD